MIRGQIIRKVGSRENRLIVFDDEDGTLFACLFKRKVEPAEWTEVDADMFLHHRTGYHFTVVAHDRYPLVCHTVTIRMSEREDWEIVPGR